MEQSREELSSLDFLKLRSQPKFLALLEEKEEIMVSLAIWKYNSDSKCQQRILVLTNTALLNILKTENIIKSIMKKLLNFQNSYTLKRRIPLQNLYGVTLPANRNSPLFLIHVRHEHDYRYRAETHKLLLLRMLAKQFALVTHKMLSFFFKDECVLINYCTMKSHLKEKREVKPKDNPHYLTDDYFLDRKFEDEDYIPGQQSNPKVKPNHFKRVELSAMRAGEKYYVLKEEMNRSVRIQNLHTSPLILNPEFSFYSDKKELLFTPFMPGGTLPNFLASRLPLSKQDALFYVAQLLHFLSKFHSQQKIYSNLVLTNIFVKENGYLVMDGLERSILSGPQLADHFGTAGDPRYFPPEVITCRGFNHSVDVWKLGICAYYLITGNFPFSGPSIKDLYHNILTKQIEAVPNYILRMLEKDRNLRITVEELRQQPELSGVNWEGLEGEKAKPPFLPVVGTWQGKLPRLYQLKEQA